MRNEELEARLQNCIDIIDLIIKTLQSKQQTNPSDEEKEPESEKVYSLPDVRKILADKSRAGYRAEVKVLLEGFGADKLSEIKPDMYPALVEKAEAIGNAQ